MLERDELLGALLERSQLPLQLFDVSLQLAHRASGHFLPFLLKKTTVSRTLRCLRIIESSTASFDNFF